MQRTRPSGGLTLVVLSALLFGVGGPFVRPLLGAGWSPSAGVLARCAGTAAVLAVPALLLLRGRWRVLRRNAGLIVAYGVVAVAGVQLLFYSAITRIPVGVALLIEYLAPVLLVLWAWARTRRRPGAAVLAGSAVAIAGLVLVVGPGRLSGDAGGYAMALLAAVGVAVYYVVNARADPDLHPVVLLAAAMTVASALLVLVGVTGLVPLRVALVDVHLAGRTAPWWISAAVAVVASTLLAYLTGVAGARRTGSRVASFAGLTEVLFAVLAAWALLGQTPTPPQAAGGALILVGVVLVRLQPEAPVLQLEPQPVTSAARGRSPVLPDSGDAAPIQEERRLRRGVSRRTS